jgi:hypothetical protein
MIWPLHSHYPKVVVTKSLFRYTDVTMCDHIQSLSRIAGSQSLKSDQQLPDEEQVDTVAR